ncbi:MAG: hypothetical protein Q9167_000488 [Letrouitia subvulpina]
MRYMSILLAAILITSFTGFTIANKPIGHSKNINYTTVTGYFLQDEPTTNATTFNFTTTNFGLINRTYPTDQSYDPYGKKTQWQRFAHQITNLNRNSPRHVHYKLLFLGRHGDGFHNDAQAFYGTPAWNCFYSEIDGNATVTWADAHLSPLGVFQALNVHTFWSSQFQSQNQPAPQSYYTSPLTRCLQTANYTFSGLELPKKYPFVPIVKELLREGISGHTCDRRSNATYIRETYPSYKIEDPFPEKDPLWQELHGETNTDQSIRSRIVLDEIFEADRSTYISITSHSGEIASILGGTTPLKFASPMPIAANQYACIVLKHRSFPLNTGAVIPVLIKAETSPSAPTPVLVQPFTPLCTCTSPPAVSATTSICSNATGAEELPVYKTAEPPGRL